MKVLLPKKAKNFILAGLLISLNFTFVTTSAQSLFFHNNCNVHPAYGDSLTGNEIHYDTTGFQPGLGGTGVSWNLSSLTTTSTPAFASELYLDPSLTPYGATFAAANMAAITANAPTNYKYYEFSPDSVTQLGTYASTTNCTYPVYDPFRYTVCPFNYGDSYVDYYNHYNCGNNQYSRSYNTSTFTFDGTGNLTLPTVTYNNVIRYKYATVGVDSTFNASNQFTMAMNFSFTSYIWLDASNPLTPLVFVYQEISYPSFGFFTKGILSVNYTHFPTIATVGIENNYVDQRMSVYPVPANDFLSVKFSESVYSDSFKIYNCIGIVMKEGITSETIDVKSLEKGVYFLETTTKEGKKARQKFIKE